MRSIIAFIPFLLLALTAEAQYTTIYEGGRGTSNSIDSDFSNTLLYQGNNNGQGPVNHSVYYHNGNTQSIGQLVYGPQVNDFALCMGRQFPEMATHVNFTFNVGFTEHTSDAQAMYFSIYTFPGNSCTSVPHEQQFQGTMVCAGVVDSTITIPYTNTTGDQFVVMQVFYESFDSVAFTIDYLKVAMDRSVLMNTDSHGLENWSVVGFDREITVDLPADMSYQLEVSNLLGQTVASERSTGKSTIPVDQPGFYVVSAYAGDQRVTKKVYLP